MTILEIEGRRIEVDDSFLALSPEEQETFVDEIAETFSPQQTQQAQIPDIATNVGAKQDLGAEEVGVAEDVVRSAGTGVRTGLEQLAGLPGDVKELFGGALDLALSSAGVAPETAQQVSGILSSLSVLPGAPTTEQIQEVTTSVVGEPRQPQTTAGEFARTIGEFAPAAAAGPGGVARKAALAVVPGAASEAAGQLTEGTAAEPFARLGGALVGGGIAAGRGGATAVKQTIEEAPTVQAVKQATDQLYDGLRRAGIVYDPDAFGFFAVDLARKLKKAGFRQATAPRSLSIAEEIGENVGQGVDFSDLEALRRAAGNLRGGPDKTESAAARSIVEAIDKFVQKAPATSKTGIAGKELRKVQAEARELASRNIKARAITEAIEDAKTAQAGFESGLRNRFGALLRNKKTKNMFNKEEKRAIQDVAGGNITNNALGFFGRFGIDPTNLGNRAALIPGLAAGGAATAGEPVSGAILVGLGTLSKFAAKTQTEQLADRALKTVLSGKSAQKQAASARRLENQRAQVRRLIAGEAGTRSSGLPVQEFLGQPDG